MTDYNAEDRVILIDKLSPGASDNSLLHEGMLGTVTNESRDGMSEGWVPVWWDENVEGHSCSNTAPAGHGWRVHCSALELYGKETFEEIPTDDLYSLLV